MRKKKLFKRLVVSTIALLSLTNCLFSVSAVSSDSTKTYNVNGYDAHGQVVLYPTHATATTYCESSSAGKATVAIHKYKTSDGTLAQTQKGSLSSYTYNNSTNLSVSTSTPSDFYLNRGAVGKHKVKSGGMTWSSVDSSDNSKVS